ncbi:type 2 periplasmic-binding domain-containing protein [Paenibacillus cymbidii]|uniref:ABC transporter substrate-binding protein n=1 Tax=Paenibacillus cymbidii TaxID=1639034 RepID=UPI00107FEEDE|nr:ABC transporter substrate-binding protein [Paenibacillus cymbidii]
MKWKRYAAATLGLSLAVTAAACSSSPGKSNEGAKASTQPSASAKATESAKPAENKKFTISALFYNFGAVSPTDGPGLAEFNKKFNVDLKVTNVLNTSFEEKMTAMFASGDIPDATTLNTTMLNGRYAQLARQGALLPLDDYIAKYPSLKIVPSQVWDALKVDGKIYGIPSYYPKFGLTPMIRQDWLDALGLKMPTNYQELKQVALAFTKNDPDKNGKNDTYGLAMSQNINPDFNMGAYWDANAWYHKNKDGQFIPGIIGPGRKELISMFADLYKEGAMTRDFAVMTWPDVNKEFYSGKAGIFIGTPRGMGQANMEGLYKLYPNAKLTPIPPFADPNGNTGFTAGINFNAMTVLSAKLAKEPDKLQRVLEISDFSRKFYPYDQRNPNNADFDFWNGKNTQGYDMVDGNVVRKADAAAKGLGPWNYWFDVNWPANDTDIDYRKDYSFKPLVDLTDTYMKLIPTWKYYVNPSYTAYSKTNSEKGAELTKFLMDEQTKMIAGNTSVADWDKMVTEYMNKGGTQVIKEMNEGIKIKDPKENYK